MEIIRCKDYQEVSEAAAKIVAEQVKKKPDTILGLPTGSTPLGMYRRLIEMNQNGEVDFGGITTFNLDEYYPISKDNNQSYHHFMHTNFFDSININKANIHILNGEAAEPEAECEKFEQMIQKSGGIDLQVLGIGQNGHIGFNEPADYLQSKTHITDLTESTINANARFFESASQVPVKAITMGVGTIMKSKKIIILISGKEKVEAARAIVEGKITTQNPSTILNAHSNVTIICDQDI